jgi:hypothetical protein
MCFHKIHLIELIFILLFCMIIFAQNSEDKLIIIEENNIGDTDISKYKEGDVNILLTFLDLSGISSLPGLHIIWG